MFFKSAVVCLCVLIHYSASVSISSKANPDLIHKDTCGMIYHEVRITEDGCTGFYAAMSCSGFCSSYEFPKFNTRKLTTNAEVVSQMFQAKYNACQPSHTGYSDITITLVCEDGTEVKKRITRPALTRCGCRQQPFQIVVVDKNDNLLD